jgi:hypothetical protein
MEKRCACEGFTAGPSKIHRGRCRRMTEKELVVDVDIRPLPLCDECWLICWIGSWHDRPEAWTGTSPSEADK